jgi:hypothetical protein
MEILTRLFAGLVGVSVFATGQNSALLSLDDVLGALLSVDLISGRASEGAEIFEPTGLAVFE